jgi:hypothetical protein
VTNRTEEVMKKEPVKRYSQADINQPPAGFVDVAVRFSKETTPAMPTIMNENQSIIRVNPC